MHLLAGKPLLFYTIEAAMNSKHLTEVFISSDDIAIQNFARKRNCKVVIRPRELSSDDSLASDVVKHFLATCNQKELSDSILVYLQPTSPLRTGAHIDEALELMIRANAKGVTSLTESKISPFKSFRLDQAGFLNPLFGKRLQNHNRQKLPKCYHANGAIYAFYTKVFLRKRCFPDRECVGYLMDSSVSIDIDDPKDLSDTERIIKLQNET